jgi:HK97 family phage major capsid protein
MSITIKPGQGLWVNNTAPAPLTGVVDTSDVKAIVPEVLAASIERKLGLNIKFLPLADVNSQLVGSPGASVTYPTWSYIGDAKDVDEGGAVGLDEIQASTKSFIVKKIAKDLKLTDEAIEATNNAVVNEIDSQFAFSIGSKVDNDVLANLRAAKTATAIPTVAADISQEGLAQLRVAYGEDIENTVLMISSKDYGKILALKELVVALNGQPFMAGHVGTVMGINLVISDKLAEKEAFLIRPGALGIAYKRQLRAEQERDMEHRSTRVGVDLHYVTYVRDETKAKAVTLSPVVTP